MRLAHHGIAQIIIFTAEHVEGCQGLAYTFFLDWGCFYALRVPHSSRTLGDPRVRLAAQIYRC